jgi:AMMECR1 domain-containing protein
MAATRDPRFLPVSLAELAELAIEVSVIGDEEPVRDTAELDPAVYGVVVRDGGGRRGVLLPGIDGISTGLVQVALARKKAGIAPDAPLRLSRFRVQKWHEAMKSR